jgi:DNA-binding LacI/PurR family transcriptional regulator
VAKHEVSISDIARAAGVSHPTVSRALRDSPLISAEVRERIQRLAQEMGYTPNAIAQSLQMRRSNTIGLVVPSMADPFFGDVVKGVEEVAHAANLSVLLSASSNDPGHEMAVIETLHRRRVDGILTGASRITSRFQHRLNHIKVPTVLINSQAESLYTSLYWVSVDDHKGARLAVEHLLALGHRKIGYLGLSSRPRSNQNRLEGYHQTLKAAGISEGRAVVLEAGTDASPEKDLTAGHELLPQLLDTGVTAVFCYNDMVAVGLLHACRERGIAVPEELSVVSYDNIPIAGYTAPPLTTINQPKARMGRIATKMLLDLLNARPVRNHTLAPTLVVRASTAAPPQR